MSFDTIVAELKRSEQTQANQSYSNRTHVTESDIQRWTDWLNEPRAVLYDRLAQYLALGFYHSELTFEFCDAIVNDLHGIMTFADEDRPDLFWQVYLAFDEGEYYHRGNRDEDPVVVYTRPLIAQIIKAHFA